MTKQFRKFSILINVLLLTCTLVAQESLKYTVNIQHLNLEDGLSNANIQAIHQDSRGFFWYGTKYGLNRYDGYDFKWFTKEKNGLVSNETQLILEDKEGWLWLFETENWEGIYGIKNLAFLNIHTLEVQSVKERFGTLPFLVSDIFSAIANEKGEIWLGLRNGDLVKYSELSTFKIHQSSISRSNLKLYQQVNDKKLIVATFSKDYKERLPLILDHFNQIKEPLNIEQNILPFAADASGTVFLGLYNDLGRRETFYGLHKETGLKKINLKELGISDKSLENDWLSYPYWDKTRQWIWYKSTNSLIAFHPEAGLQYDFHQFSQIIGNEIHRLFFDKKGFVYIGTAQGVYLLQLKKPKFNKYLYKDPNQHGYNETYSCRQIVKLGNELFVNTNKNRQRINLNSGQVLSLLPQSTGANIKMDFVLTVLKDSKNELWFGDNILSKYDPLTGKETSFLNLKNNISKIWCIFEATPDKLWLGLENAGYSIFDKNTETFQLFDKYNQYKTLAKSTIYQFKSIDADRYLIASTSGIYLLHREKGILQRYWSGGKEGNYFPSDNILHIHKDKAGKFWIGTGGNGLLECSLNDTTLIIHHQFTIADGLANNVIYGVYEDEKGWLWMPSDYGIMRFDKKSHRSKVYLPDDGISFTEYNRLSHYQDENGTLYFGSINGVTAFHPRDFWEDYLNYEESILIANFAFLNKETGLWEDNTTAFNQDVKIRLTPAQQSFSLSFFLNDFFESSKKRFSYRIKGVNEQWTYLDNNVLTVWQLPTGQYDLEVRAQGNNGQFSKHQLTIPIQVIPPFYLQAWFILLSLALLGIVLYGIFKRKAFLMQQQQKILEQKVSERTAELKAEKAITEAQNQQLKTINATKDQLFAIIGHDLRKPALAFRGISKKVEFLIKENQIEVVKQLGESLEQSAINLNKLLDNLLKWALSQRDALTYTAQPLDIQPIIADIDALFSQVVRDKDIALHISIPPAIQVLGDADTISTIMRNLVDNAIKFTPKGGSVTVSAKKVEENIVLRVKDTGIGMNSHQVNNLFKLEKNKSKKGTAGEKGAGLGMVLVKELVSMYRGKINIDSRLNQGTTIEVLLPAA